MAHKRLPGAPSSSAASVMAKASMKKSMMPRMLTESWTAPKSRSSEITETWETSKSRITVSRKTSKSRSRGGNGGLEGVEVKDNGELEDVKVGVERDNGELEDVEIDEIAEEVEEIGEEQGALGDSSARTSK